MVVMFVNEELLSNQKINLSRHLCCFQLKLFDVPLHQSFSDKLNIFDELIIYYDQCSTFNIMFTTETQSASCIPDRGLVIFYIFIYIDKDKDASTNNVY